MSDSEPEGILHTISKRFSGLQFRLVLMVVLASLPPVVLTVHIARQDRQRQTAALRQRSQDIVKLAARKEDEMIGGTRQLLRAVAESAQMQSAQWGNGTKLLRTLYGDYPRYANLGVIKTNGEVPASALPLTNTVNLADRSYFQRALATRDLSIGDYQVGRITGKPSFNLGYPVFDSSGQVQAVVFAALDLDWLDSSDYALQVQLPQGATWTKIDGKGTILVRYPAPEKGLVGEPLPEQSLLKTFLAQKNGVMEAVDPKGIRVFYDFTSTRSALVAGDVISILSIPRKVLFAEPNHVMIRNLTSVGLVAGLVLVIGWIGSRYLVLRPIQALVNFTARLGAGDHSARTGLPRVWNELRQLMGAFDQMAEALQQREAERQQAVKELTQSEERFRALVQNSTDVTGITDKNGLILYRSPNLLTTLGYEAADAPGKSIFDYFWPEDLPRAQSRLAELAVAPGNTQRDEYRLRHKNGSCRFIESMSSNHLEDPAIGGVVFNYRDITERKRAQGRLKESRQRLQTLSRRLVKVQETERRHLARELHDEIGQGLTVAELNLQALLQLPGTDALAPRLQESLYVVERVLEQVHDLSLNLRPSMLDDLGLEPALRWYIERQAALAGLQAEVRVDPLEQRLDPMIETECFRVAQEALTNVVKHAKARTVTVELTTNDEQLHLSVRDDGVGFDVAGLREKAVRGASLGLLSMEERATLAGGGLQYHATPGQGTEVHAWFPLKWAHPAALIGAI
jgi:PAS domain S-box-containing protein